ncbi:MAG TPA: TIR domain-containing protein [Subdoligranulum variabile]|uniref:TIR domain-containing protein n=1 Tax=Subdoligranulum variabile TaxID=214851 RepID=A0A921LP14_9FIRM|nr:TIR domain-containing protein [Subdoligranulum variabile]
MGLTTEQKEKRRQDPHVQYIKDRICNKDTGKPYVFISYKSDDWEPVLQGVVYKLVKDYGLNVYFDGDFDNSSAGWLKQFQENMDIESCKGVLVFRSPQYMTSYATVLELMYSQSGLATDNDEPLPLVCINLAGSEYPDTDTKETTGLGDSTHNINANPERECFSQIVNTLHEQGRIGWKPFNRFKKEQAVGVLSQRLCRKIAEAVLQSYRNGIQEKDPQNINSIVNTIKTECGEDVFEQGVPDASSEPTTSPAPQQTPAAVMQTPDNLAPAAPASYTPPVAEGYTYTLFGQTYHAGSREQGKLMYDTFAALVQRFPDRIPALTRRTSVARAEDVTNANTREAKPPYFRICRSFPVNGQNYLVGISYGFEAKLAEIRGMLKLCGVNPAEFVLIQGGASSTANTTPASVSSSPSAPERAATGPAASPADGGTVFRYTLWGTLCTADTLANLMHDVFDRIAERYPDKVPQMAADNSLSAVARRDDVDNSRLPANKLNYFKACRLHTVAGQEYYVSTRYGREQGIAQLEKMLQVCEGRSDALEILSAPQKSVHNRSN